MSERQSCCEEDRKLLERPLKDRLSAFGSFMLEPSINIFAVLVAFAGGAILIAIMGFSPLDAYAALIKSSFGSWNSIAETLAKTAPLLLAGLGTSIAFQTNLFSIGAEGQIYMGAVGAGIVGLQMGDISPIIGLPLVLLMGALFGAVWGGIVGYLRIKFRVDVVIVSLMFNSIAIHFAKYLMIGPWQWQDSTMPITERFAVGSWLPILIPGTRLHLGIAVGIIAALLMWWMMRHTVLGYRVEVMGENIDTARAAGINTGAMIMIVMLLSGALSGLAGAGEVAGLEHRLIAGLSPGYGYTAIAITQLGRRNPLGIFLSSLLFAALLVGATGMQRISGVPFEVVQIIQGLVLLSLMGSEGYRLIQRLIQRIIKKD